MFINKRVKILIFILFGLLVGLFIEHNQDIIHVIQLPFQRSLRPFRKPPSQAKQVKEVTQPEFPFFPGEQLKYGIYSSSIKVGHATITYKGRQKLANSIVDVIVVEAKAPGFYDVDTIYGFIESFTPLKVERKINLFGEAISILEEYNLSADKVVITRQGRKTTIEKLESSNKIGNIILLLYYFRHRERKFDIGDRFEFNLPTKKLEMVVDKFSKLVVPKGRFNALFIHSIPSKFKVWLDPENGNIPLRIQGAIGFGNTYLALIDVEKSR